MIDTVNIYLTSYDICGVDFMEETSRYLYNSKLVRYNCGREYICGELSNLKVSVSPERLNIYGGSLCKFYKGNNYEALTDIETREAFEKLSDVLHVPVLKARVKRVDIGLNLLMKHAPILYLSHLGSMGRKKRISNGTTLYYGLNSPLCVCFYDKNAESRRRRHTIPGKYMCNNVLRYELRLTGNLSRAFGVEHVTASTLCDLCVQGKLLYIWIDTYRKIEKVNCESPDFNMLMRPHGINIAGKLALLELYGGIEALKQLIYEAMCTGYMSRQKCSYLKRSFANAYRKGGKLSTKNELIRELDEAIIKVSSNRGFICNQVVNS